MEHLKLFEEYQSTTRIHPYDGKHKPFPRTGSEESVSSGEGYLVGDNVIIDGEEAEIFEIIQRMRNDQPDFWFKVIFKDGSEDVVQSNRFEKL